jgi:ribosome biogenesis GTPase
MSKRRKRPDDTARYHAGGFDNADDSRDSDESAERFGERSKNAQQRKILQTALLRAEDPVSEADLAALPIGEVVQVFSLFYEVEHESKTWLCVARKTLQKLAESGIVVGDRVKFRDVGVTAESGKPEGVIEQVLPRATVLTRAAGTHGQQPIVANADQMLIVASIVKPAVKWGLIDRMIVAAQSGKLKPIICLNKIDLIAAAGEYLAHYESLGVAVLKTSIVSSEGLVELRNVLRDKSTVLAGHSGVGKSSLIRAIQPDLDIRIGAISGYTGKGIHTTTSARRYKLDIGGEVIDTPGVKLFGLWNVTRENLLEFFPDVDSGNAPQWRVESYERISDSLSLAGRGLG